MRTYLIVMSLFLLLGCKEPNIEQKTERIYVNTKCPTFNSKLKINILELDTNYAKISWKDVDKIEKFLGDKKTFNKEVKKLNNEK